MITTERLSQYALRLLPFVIPSFLHGFVPGTRRPSQSTKPLHASASLDGLRGVASFGVFILHFTYTFCNDHDWVWGTREQDHYWFQLPFINAFWRGPSLVACFFIISGYVLTIKPLRQIRARPDEAFLQTMSSSIFRRGLRLYIPTLCATFVTMLLVWAGAFESARTSYKDGTSVFMVEEPPYYVGNLTGQFDHWRNSIAPLVDLFHLDKVHSEYDPHLWTIPIEFRGSMLIFLFTVGICGLTTPIRIALEQVVIIYCIRFGQEDIVLFFVGLHLAELHLLLNAFNESRQHSDSALPLLAETIDNEKLPPTTASPITRESRRSRVFYIFLFVLGLFLTGMPFIDGHGSYGYHYFLYMCDHPYFWQCFGPLLIIVAALLSPTIALLFTNSFAQYLGKISYALYIVHGNVRRSITFATMPTIWRIVGGKDSHFHYACAVILAAMINFPITIWLADCFWRAVDERSVRFARWAEGKCRRKD